MYVALIRKVDWGLRVRGNIIRAGDQAHQTGSKIDSYTRMWARQRVAVCTLRNGAGLRVRGNIIRAGDQAHQTGSKIDSSTRMWARQLVAVCTLRNGALNIQLTP